MAPRARRTETDQEELLLAILEELQDMNGSLDELKNLMTKLVDAFQSIFLLEGKMSSSISGHVHGSVSSKNKKTSSNPVTTSMDILRMRPGTLKTYKTVQKLGEATCTQVAEITGRTHGLESRYLNELARHGLLTKKRVSDGKRHYVVYSVTEDHSSPIE